MDIKIDRDGSKMVITVSGRIDTLTAPELDAKKSELDGVNDLILDITEVDYISSAGLRALLTFEQIMEDQGELKLKGVCSNVMDIFEITGFAEMFTIID